MCFLSAASGTAYARLGLTPIRSERTVLSSEKRITAQYDDDGEPCRVVPCLRRRRGFRCQPVQVIKGTVADEHHKHRARDDADD
jgi:hypothetical protein